MANPPQKRKKKKNIIMNYRVPLPFFVSVRNTRLFKYSTLRLGKQEGLQSLPHNGGLQQECSSLLSLCCTCTQWNIFTKTSSPQWLPGRTASYPVLASMHKHTRGRWSPYWQIQFCCNPSPRVMQTVLWTKARRTSPYQSRDLTTCCVFT